MKREIAVSIATYQIPSTETTKPYIFFRLVNEILEANNADLSEFYPEEDIRYSEFLEEVLSSQREIDIVLVSNFFYRVYRLLHIDIKTLNLKPNPYDSEQIKNVYNALDRLGKKHLLTNGLKKSIIKKYLI